MNVENRRENPRRVSIFGCRTLCAVASLDVMFRGAKQKIRAGETIHIPANAPHQFHNSAPAPARMFCICAPAGQEDFFRQLGVVVETRTTPPPALDAAAFAVFREKAAALAPKFRTEFVKA